jgi:hypothetical protein
MLKFFIGLLVTIAVFLALVSVAAAGYCPPKNPPPVVVPEPGPPPAPRCQPGYGPYGGKDGDESDPYHNQECCPDADMNQKCDDVIRPGQVTANTVVYRAVRFAR